jgi:hypothetical protein
MTHGLQQMTITIGSPSLLDGKEGRRQLAAFYCELLGMEIIRDDWLKIAKDRTSALHFALDSDGWSDQRPPRWPDPEYPQQMHLDLLVRDLDGAGEMVSGLGGALLQDQGGFRIYADPAGHPFCLYPDRNGRAGGLVVKRLVFDCFSPRSLAAFYEGLLGVQKRTTDSPQRVEISFDDERLPDFAFQHAQFVAARWPDPAYPAQMHVDFGFVDGTDAAVERAERFGAIRLPKLADTEIFADPAAHPFCL